MCCRSNYFTSLLSATSPSCRLPMSASIYESLRNFLPLFLAVEMFTVFNKHEYIALINQSCNNNTRLTCPLLGASFLIKVQQFDDENQNHTIAKIPRSSNLYESI
ncbi:hypothetical protein Tcan_00867, partial [Toxocara canis]